MQRPERRVDLYLVRNQVRRAPREQVEDRGAREARGDEALLHPVARDGVDEAGRVADEERAIRGDARPGPAEREPVAAHALELVDRDAVPGAHARKVFAEARPGYHPITSGSVEAALADPKPR